MYWCDFGFIYCKIAVYQVDIKTWSSRVSYLTKSIGKSLFYLFRSPFQTIDRNIFLSFENNGTQVIQPNYMVIMLVCEKYSICLKSGPQSINIFPFVSVVIRAELRSLLSRGSEDRQTGSSEPIIGTPWEVPVPKNFSFILF